MFQPQKIIIHHSATPDGRALSWRAIHDYHVNIKGWSDIGYHAGIEQIEDHFICMFGRPRTLVGAHAKGQNSSSLGFCFVGNFDERPPGPERLRIAARRVLAPWLVDLGAGVDALVAHRHFANKTCPGSRFSMEQLQEIVYEELVQQRAT